MPFWTILVILIILTILVEIMTFVHELGHFMVAKFNKATVVEFAIGFGPALYQKRIGDTTYSFRALPFGGYVAVLSDEIIVGLEKLKKMDLTPQQAVNLKKQLKGFDEKTDWSEKPTIDKVSAPRKVWFALMGVTMNFFMLWALLFVTYASAGKKEDNHQMFILPIIASLNEIIPESTTLEAATPEYELSMADNPIHKDKIDKTRYLPLYSESIAFDIEAGNDKTGEEYYNAITKEMENSAIWKNTDEINSDVNISYINLTKDLESDLSLTYDETDEIDAPSTKASDNFWYGEYIFDYLIKDNKTNCFYLMSSESVLFEPSNFQNNNSLVNSFWKPGFGGDDKTITISNALAIPVAKEQKGEIVPMTMADVTNDTSKKDPVFGIMDDYRKMGFGESIWRSLVDSFIYLGKGFVMIFDVLTFGLVLNDGIPHMYANGQSVHNGNAGLWWGNLTLVMLIWMSYLMIVFNVLPFPPLDGWRVVEYSYEGIKKKKIADKTTMTMYKIGIALFFIVIIGGIIVGI